MNPRELPIYAIENELLDALKTHQVVVVEGPTGCGKTTQIPTILEDSGIIAPGQIIGVTQPRRIAAVSVAHRIADERGVELGTEVGYAIRFDDNTTPQTRIKVMTDGILLQEARSDPSLSRYDLIMVDEAHERTLNIDFTLGLLKQLMDSRPELRAVVSSATINPRVFARFFSDAPMLSVDSRTFPVDISWEPLEDESRFGRVDAVADVVEDIHRSGEPGDVLVFLTGEAEIKDVLLELQHRKLKRAEFLPLYGRMKRAEQERIFDRVEGKRKIVLSTNIAETSITIDGVRFVVDLGLAKVPSYDPRSGMASLTEEPISQASCRQRSGRAGRTAPGACVRMYDKWSYENRRQFQKEEVMRMDLSDVVLRLVDLGVSEVETFPFITRPPKHLIRGAVRELRDIDAIDHQPQLTDIGKRMVPFPLSARCARMIVEAADRYPDVLFEILTVAAILSTPAPQIMPTGEVDQARRAHRHFADPMGDMVAGLRMLRAYVSSADKVAFCTKHYLDPIRMEELLNVRSQLTDIARAHGLEGGAGGSQDDLIRCVSVGLIGHICRKKRRGHQYESRNGVRVAIHPGSCLYDQRPEFMVAAEMVVTRRPWARWVSALKAEVIVELDPDLARQWGIQIRAKKQRSEPLKYPPSLVLGGETVKVGLRRGEPSVDISWTVAKQCAEDMTDLESAAALFAGNRLPRSRLIYEGEVFLRGWPLDRIVAVAPLLRLDEDVLERWPEGDLFEADRDGTLICRWVPHLLQMARSRRRNRAAFLTLIGNGAGGFWFDAARDLRLAVDQSLMALERLLAEPVFDDGDQVTIQTACSQLQAVQVAIDVE